MAIFEFAYHNHLVSGDNERCDTCPGKYLIKFTPSFQHCWTSHMDTDTDHLHCVIFQIVKVRMSHHQSDPLVEYF